MSGRIACPARQANDSGTPPIFSSWLDFFLSSAFLTLSSLRVSLSQTHGADFQAVLAVAVGADDLRDVGLAGTATLPAGDDLGGGGVVLLVAFLAHRVDSRGGIDHLRRRDVVLVVAMGQGLAMALHAAHIGLRVRGGQRLFLVVGMADMTRTVVGDRAAWLDSRRGLFVRRVEQQRGAFVDLQGRRPGWLSSRPARAARAKAAAKANRIPANNPRWCRMESLPDEQRKEKPHQAFTAALSRRERRGGRLRSKPTLKRIPNPSAH